MHAHLCKYMCDLAALLPSILYQTWQCTQQRSLQHQFLTSITKTGSQDVEGKELELQLEEELPHKLGESSHEL